MAEFVDSSLRVRNDWSKCIICKRTKNKEKVICPGKSKTINARGVYENFIQNVDEFNSVCGQSKVFNFERDR